MAVGDKPLNEAAVDTSEGSEQDRRKVCGIVMPIAAMPDDYPEEHWRRVRNILQRAVERAGLRPQLVWQNAEIDVIQSAILQNLYENDVVVCDVSGLNPNVMLETGLRLSTRRPTIIVTDKVKPPPFDISTIGYLDYQRDLEYNAIEGFIGRLAAKINDVVKAVENKSYKSFVENFRFETVTPSTVTVSSDEYIKEKLGELATSVARLERAQRKPISVGARSPEKAESPFKRDYQELGSIHIQLSTDDAVLGEARIDSLSNMFCVRRPRGDDRWEFFIYHLKVPGLDVAEAMMKAERALSQFNTSMSTSYL